MPSCFIEDNEDYQLFLDFKKTFLINGCSYFNKSLQVVTKENLDNFEERFIKNYISGNQQNFKKKAISQLKNSSREFKHLFANYLWLYNFFSSSVNSKYYRVDKLASTKYNEIKSYLEEDIESNFIPKDGFVNCGMAYKRGRYAEICYIHIFIKEIFENQNLLIQEENLIKFIKEMNVKEQLKNYVGEYLYNAGIKNILLFLLVPDKFEPIVSYRDKKSIVKGFEKYILIDSKKNTERLEIDEKLLLIREECKITKSFYEEEYKSIWKNKQNSKNTNIKPFKKAIVISNLKKQNLNIVIGVKSNDDLHKEYDKKLKSGQNAEEIVFANLKDKFMSDKKDIEYINTIFNVLSNLYLLKEEIKQTSLKEISMFSKHIYTNAPFDIIYQNGQNIKFVEVKNCSSRPYKIYMSVSELNFAYEHIDNYELKIVIDNEIYDVENLPTKKLYDQVKAINSTESLLSISNFELYIEIK